MSTLRREACSGRIHDFAHIPTPNCLADCLTKASAKADNLMTAVNTGNLLDVDACAHFSCFFFFFALCGCSTSFCPAWCRWPDGFATGSPFGSLNGDSFRTAFLVEWEQEAHASAYSGQTSECRWKDPSSWSWDTQDLSDEEIFAR